LEGAIRRKKYWYENYRKYCENQTAGRRKIRMKLIIGGAYQGKLAYAQQNCCLKEEEWIDGRTCPLDAIETCGGIHHFHEYVKRMMTREAEGCDMHAQMMAGEAEGCHMRAQMMPGEAKECKAYSGQATNGKNRDFLHLEQDAEAFAECLCACNPEILIVSNELGYGVVPMEKADRLWREAAGRICCALASRADEVVRVVCGIGQRIK
jgi:adenosylcobinamide kinase/adenosylcobinamide-phosphate guanylyltransferase